MVEKYSLTFSNKFRKFLNTLDDEKSDFIIKTLIDWVNNEINLSVKTCKHFKENNKSVVDDIVIYYRFEGHEIHITSAYKMKPRVA